MVKKSLLWFYRLALWLIGLTAIIIMMTASIIHFWLMPNIGQFKDDIASYASQVAQQKITIGDIKADWQGINPHLSLNNVNLFDTESRAALQLQNIETAFSWLSIPLLEPHLSELIIQSPELTIRRTSNGEVYVAGILMGGASKPDLANWLLRQNRLGIINAKVIWIDELRKAPELSLSQLSLEVFTPPWKSLIKNHNFIFSASPSIGSNEPIRLSGSFYGNDISRVGAWRGDIVLKLINADLAAFKAWVDYPIDLRSGVGSADITAKFSQSQIQAVDSNVMINNLQLHIKPDIEPMLLNRLTGDIHWKNLNKSPAPDLKSKRFAQSISVNKLSAITGSGLHFNDLKADYLQSSEGKQVFNLTLPSINLVSIQQLLPLAPVSEALLGKISAAKPTGQLENVVIYWSAQNNRTETYRIDTEFKNLGIAAYEKIPGFNNLSGNLKATQNGGQVQLDSTKASLDIKDSLRWPVPADKLSGKINWDIKDKKTTIEIKNLDISSPHISGVIDASYLMDGNQGGYLDLKGKFNHGDAKYAPFYYPTMLGEATLHWLDTSILAGRVNDIDLVVRGRLANFPFVDSKNNPDSKQGLFRVTANISDALLEYGTGWPVIDRLALHMLFEGKRMELNANSGRILGNQIIKNKTTIAQLDADNPILNIEAEVTGPVNEGVNFVNNSPVREVTQGFTENLMTSGKGKLNLNLKIPLNNLELAHYKGLYQITNGKMQSETIPVLTQIHGSLEFTESSLAARNIQANLFGSPLSFNLNSAKDKSIRVIAKGKLTDASIKQILKENNLSKATQYISGTTDWVGDILIQKPRTSIAIRSDLIGITSRFPAPLNKSANQALSLRIDKKQEGDNENVFVNLGNKIRAKLNSTLQNGAQKFNQAYIHLSNNDNVSNVLNDTETFSGKGLSISGNLDYINADAWRYVIKNFNDSTQKKTTLPVQKIALNINTLDIFNRRFNQLSISQLTMIGGLQAKVQSREITGDLQWQDKDRGKLIARLSNFTIPDAAPDQLSAIQNDPVETNSAGEMQFSKREQDYPALDITASSFVYNKKDLGALELIAYPQNDNWDIQKLKLSSPEGIISAEGQWNNWVRSPNTYLNVQWDIKDLGNTLQRFGYPDTIKDGEGTLNGNLHWPGSPHQFDTTRLNGELQFEMRKGQILQAKPGVGRLLGLLSLQSLPRRLSLDFRDLFNNGFAFDKIKATVKIEQGLMRSDNFTMAGPAADVTIKGETDLKKETQHLFIKVMPRISDSVSLAALAGGPLAGAVAFLAQKILKDPLNKIASTEYEIIGTWDNPQEIKSETVNKPTQGITSIK